MGQVKTPWPTYAKADYRYTKEALELLWYDAQTIHNRGLQGRRRNPYLIDALVPQLRETAQELGETLRQLLSSWSQDPPEGRPPYWVEAIETMIDDLATLGIVYQDLITAHRRDSLPKARLLSDIGLEGLSYISRVYSSIPMPEKRQTTPIKAPELPRIWKEFISKLELD